MSDETPTQRLPQGEAPGEELVEERQKSRTLMFVLIGVGAALLITIIVLLVVLLGGDKGTPGGEPTATSTPSATPTASDTPTPTATPTVEPTTVPEPTQAPPTPSTIVSYGVDKADAGCTSDSDTPSITFNWNTTGTSVSFGVGTDYAEVGAYESNLPRVGGITVNYQCGDPGPDQIYSIAVIGPNGDVIGRQTITVRD